MTYIPLENLISRLENKLEEVNEGVKKELKINNQYLSEITGDTVKESDIEVK